MSKHINQIKSIVFALLLSIGISALKPCKANNCSSTHVIWDRAVLGQVTFDGSQVPALNYYVNYIPGSQCSSYNGSDPQDATSFTPGYFPQAWMVTVVNDMTDEWNNYSWVEGATGYGPIGLDPSVFAFNWMTTGSGQPLTLVFGGTVNSGAAAETNYFGSSGEFYPTEFDRNYTATTESVRINFNSNIAWANGKTGSGLAIWDYCADTGLVQAYDLNTITRHELGHSYGLTHADPPTTLPTPLMQTGIAPGSAGVWDITPDDASSVIVTYGDTTSFCSDH